MRLTPPRAAGGPSQVGKPYENDLDLAGIPRTPSWECLWHCGRVDFASPTLEATRGRLLARFGARVGPWWERLPGAIADLAALGAGRWWRRWARQHLAGGARPSPRCWPPPRPPEVPVPSRSPRSWRSHPKGTPNRMTRQNDAVQRHHGLPRCPGRPRSPAPRVIEPDDLACSAWIVATMSRCPSQRPARWGHGCVFSWRVRRTTWVAGCAAPSDRRRPRPRGRRAAAARRARPVPR
jgi:hypothetical protein